MERSSNRYHGKSNLFIGDESKYLLDRFVDNSNKRFDIYICVYTYIFSLEEESIDNRFDDIFLRSARVPTTRSTLLKTKNRRTNP